MSLNTGSDFAEKNIQDLRISLNNTCTTQRSPGLLPWNGRSFENDETAEASIAGGCSGDSYCANTATIDSSHLITSNANNDEGDFWKPRQYRRIVKRVDDGYKRCNDLSSFLLERAECEKAFSRSLYAWSKKWGDQLANENTSVEYGSSNRAWSAFLVESNRIASMHTDISESLRMVVNRLKSWQRDYYVKGVLHNKTVKEFDDDFKKAQKPWTKAQIRLQKAKRDFHSASRSLNTAETIKTSTDCDMSLTAENKKKAAERFVKACREKQLSEERYRSCIDELGSVLPVYKENMLQVFNRSRSFEKERLICFKDIFQSASQSLDFSNRSELRKIYMDLSDAVEAMDPCADVSYWSQQCGADSSIAIPEFEEFPGEMSGGAIPTIHLSDKNFNSPMPSRLTTFELENTSNHDFKRTTQDDLTADPPDTCRRQIGFVSTLTTSVNCNKPASVYNTPSQNDSNKNALSNNENNQLSVKNTNSQPVFIVQKDPGEYPEICNPFHADPPLPPPVDSNRIQEQRLNVDYHQVSVPVRALYSYIPQEADELALEEGMVFTMTAGEDEQGWSRGKYGSKEGLYPAAYAEPLEDYPPTLTK